MKLQFYIPFFFGQLTLILIYYKLMINSLFSWFYVFLPITTLVGVIVALILGVVIYNKYFNKNYKP
jgi:hypothetical protein